jgi:hypothetical protein
MHIPLPLPTKEENRTQTLKAELEFQGSMSSFWWILKLEAGFYTLTGENFWWRGCVFSLFYEPCFLPLLYFLEQQQLKQQCKWLVYVSARNCSGVHCNVFMCLNLVKCNCFQSMMCLFCRDGQRHMYGGLLSARILLHSTRKVLLCGVDLSLARKWDSLILVYSLLISHHVKSMYPGLSTGH